MAFFCYISDGLVIHSRNSGELSWPDIERSHNLLYLSNEAARSRTAPYWKLSDLMNTYGFITLSTSFTISEVRWPDMLIWRRQEREGSLPLDRSPQRRRDECRGLRHSIHHSLVLQPNNKHPSTLRNWQKPHCRFLSRCWGWWRRSGRSTQRIYWILIINNLYVKR